MSLRADNHIDSVEQLWEELQGARSLVDQLAIQKGKHTIKLGGEIRYIRTDNYQPNPNSGSFNFANTFTNQYADTALKQLGITPTTAPAGAAG